MHRRSRAREGRSQRPAAPLATRRAAATIHASKSNQHPSCLYFPPAVNTVVGVLVAVTVEPPAVTRVEFDRREPPPEMPSTSLDGSGVCKNVFEIEASIESSIEWLTPTSVRAYPENFAIITRLEVTIYVAKGSPAKLHAHEEGHRAIGEHYYGDAEAAARTAALSLVGRVFEASGADRAAAERAAGEQILSALKEAFMRRTHARSAAANARYDAITEHGLNAIGEREAVAAAIGHDP
jgi:hypothetical protein